MSEPLVCAIILTRDRPEMAAHAVRCFREQTYQNKELFILDTGKQPGIAWDSLRHREGITRFGVPPKGIGVLRNIANDLANQRTEIFLHWDDDDYSRPNRISEQVALLQSSGAECVGYHSMYFWDAEKDSAYLYTGQPGYAIGTSLCYWRATWEKRPFLDVPIGEDSKFLDGTNARGERIAEPLRVSSVSANGALLMECDMVPMGEGADGFMNYTPGLSKYSTIEGEPRMVARVHSASLSYKAGNRHRMDVEPFSRVTEPAVIEYCRKAMAL